MNIKITEVKSKKDLSLFVSFANKLYKNCDDYCPAIEFDEKNTFNTKKNPALEFSEFCNFLAWKDGKLVGRICALINNRANAHWNVKKVRFGWFDFIDDYEVSSALLDAAKNWGKEKGMEILNGPVGFTDFDHQGLLLEGFEYDSPMTSLYNFPYYVKHFEKYGLTKEADWVEYKVFIPDEIPEKMERISKIVTDRYHLKIDKVKSTKELIKKYGYTYFDVIDSTYQKLYNFQPLTQRQKEYYCKMYFPMLNFDFITIITNEQDEIVGVGIGMPDISVALRKCNGKLFPFGWFSVIKSLKSKKHEVIDLMLIAVREYYQNKGVNALFFHDQLKYFHKYGVKHAESSAILENNVKHLANWDYFETLQHKRRRAYIKPIE
ncbi:MAG: N-acetyltransferase [Bacteroidales bacterium]|nr:N-acetyltransferase [Bacteroidales bacterium]